MNDADISCSPRKARVEIIPLIDVVFFLLATFVLFTLSLNKIGVLDLTLPDAGKGDPEDTLLYLQASDADSFFWKQGPHGLEETISGSELRARLEEYRNRVKVPRVFISGDDRARFGATIRALDEVRRVQIKQVTFETAPRR